MVVYALLGHWEYEGAALVKIYAQKGQAEYARDVLNAKDKVDREYDYYTVEEQQVVV